MPSKRLGKTASKVSPRRGRSKSAGRSSTKMKPKRPSRSRSRSRASNVTKRSRTPASESKVQRRRSSSSSSESSNFKPRVMVPKILLQNLPDGSGDKRARSTVMSREITPSRFSQRIIEKIETTRATAVRERSRSPSRPSTKSQCSIWSTVNDFFRQKICPSPFLAALNVLAFLPLPYWLNLFIFTPVQATSSNYTSFSGVWTTGFWGPSRPFASVMWPTDWHVYLNVGSFVFVFAYWFMHFLLARFVPIGFRVSSIPESRRLDYRCNGLCALIVTMCLFGVTQMAKSPSMTLLKPSQFLPKYMLGLITASNSFAVIWSLLVYFISKRTSKEPVNNEGDTGNFFVDLWNGRLTRPRWWGLDWKMFILRPAVIGMLLIDLCYVCAQWDRFGRVTPTLLAITMMHFIWISDFFIFEHAHLFTYDTRYEGFGFFTIGGSMLMPFLYTATTSYLSTKREGPLTWNAKDDIIRCTLFGFSILLFLIGYWIYRSSNNQKALFRRQPNHPVFADMDKIAGPYTQRLLAGGWWGFVRHPNYLGDLLMAYASGIICGFQSILPWIYPIFLTCFLIHRIWRIEYHNSRRYGLGMAMYQKMVPSRLIPKVY